jgi:hypothetical protein
MFAAVVTSGEGQCHYCLYTLVARAPSISAANTPTAIGSSTTVEPDGYAVWLQCGSAQQTNF